LTRSRIIFPGPGHSPPGKFAEHSGRPLSREEISFTNSIPVPQVGVAAASSPPLQWLSRDADSVLDSSLTRLIPDGFLFQSSVSFPAFGACIFRFQDSLLRGIQ